MLLPAFNEEITIAKTIETVSASLPKATIVVIDNGSTDNTKDMAEKQGSLVVHEPRKGKGFAVQRGFNFAIAEKFDVVFLVDADETYGMENLENAIQLVLKNGFDMVVGTRTIKKNEVAGSKRRSQEYRRGHRLGNKIFFRIAQLLFPTGIEDVLSGWRVMSRRFVASFPGDASGFEIESKLNSHAYMTKAAVTNVPVSYSGRPKGSASKLNTFEDGSKIFRSNLKHFRSDRPFVAFSLLAVPWALLTIYFLYKPLTTYLESGLVPNLPRFIAATGTFMVASLLWISGVILERTQQVRSTIILERFNHTTYEPTE